MVQLAVRSWVLFLLFACTCTSLAATPLRGRKPVSKPLEITTEELITTTAQAWQRRKLELCARSASLTDGLTSHDQNTVAYCKSYFAFMDALLQEKQTEHWKYVAEPPVPFPPPPSAEAWHQYRKELDEAARKKREEEQRQESIARQEEQNMLMRSRMEQDAAIARQQAAQRQQEIDAIVAQNALLQQTNNNLWQLNNNLNR